MCSFGWVGISYSTYFGDLGPVEFPTTVMNIAPIGLFRRRHFKSTGSQQAHRPPVVQRVTASSRMNQLAYHIVMISIRPYHDFPLVFQTLAAVESTRPPV